VTAGLLNGTGRNHIYGSAAEELVQAGPQLIHDGTGRRIRGPLVRKSPSVVRRDGRASRLLLHARQVVAAKSSVYLAGRPVEGARPDAAGAGPAREAEQDQTQLHLGSIVTSRTVAASRTAVAHLLVAAGAEDWLTGSGHCSQPAEPTPAKGSAPQVMIGDFTFRGYIFLP
jgi:hypothetical protein